MSDRVICDSCSAIIYSDFRHCRITVQVESRYGDGLSPRTDKALDLCKKCDEKVADALIRLLPHLAGAIDPNAFGRAREAAATRDGGA